MSGDGAWSGFEQQAGLPARFPMRVEDAMEDAGEAVLAAIDEGVARVRIQLNLPEFDPSEMPMEKGCLLSFINGLGGGLVDRGLRANFVFNTVLDASYAKRHVTRVPCLVPQIPKTVGKFLPGSLGARPPTLNHKWHPPGPRTVRSPKPETINERTTNFPP